MKINVPRLFKLIDDEPVIRSGIGGNVYTICKNKLPLETICRKIGKSTKSIYWNSKYNCFAFRVKSKHHKKRLLLFKSK